MAMVMPRARSSGALSMVSKARYSASPLSASTLVIAAVSDVLPWSMCPIVPTFRCGFVRSNRFLAMENHYSLHAGIGCDAPDTQHRKADYALARVLIASATDWGASS